ncbi:MAG: HAD family hydrolase [Candidatus Limivicinus sp.]
MKYKLIAFDLDGTFLDDDKFIPEKNMLALCAAAEKGIYLVPATGRIVPALPEALRKLPVIRYCICSNGARIYDAKEDRTLSRAEISPDTALRMMEYMDSLPVIYDCYQDDAGWMTRSMYESAEDYVSAPAMLHMIRTLRTPVDDLKETIRERGRGLQKQQMFFADLDERQRQLKILPDMFPELLFSSSVSNNIEINSADAGKGRALETLCGILGISVSEAAAFGDGTNDLGMIKTAGLGIAMANGDEIVRSAADYVTGTNNDSGFGEAVFSLILKDD